MSAGYTSPTGHFYPKGQPWLAYGPGHTVRFFRSQNSWNGEMELNQRYLSSQPIAGWAAARPFMNRTPFVAGQSVLYNRPDGPSGPLDLLQQAAPPPTFPAGDFRRFYPDRYSPGALAVPPAGASPMAPYARSDGMSGLRGDCPCTTVDGMANAVAMGLKRILPELATSIGVQTARNNVQQYQATPAQESEPVRAYAFNAAPAGIITVNDPVNFTTIATHRVPRGLMAVAKWLLVTAESAAALDDLEVRITVDGVPSLGWNSLNQPNLNAGAPAPITVKAIEDQGIRVQVRVRTVGNTHFVTALLRGWDFVPSHMTNLDSIDGWRGR